jgi:DNA invertase Pin-like site-specific DNA recombinase
VSGFYLDRLRHVLGLLAAAIVAAAVSGIGGVIIAKLDRLSRNLAFIATLMDSNVGFIAADNPHANRLTVHILAAVAEHERGAISERTKAALAAAKRRGVKLGGPRASPQPARPPSRFYRQKFLNRSGASSVYRTVCWMFLCPSHACSARVSWPALARA